MNKGMYRLTQAEKLLSDKLIKYLEPCRYTQIERILKLWKHKSNSIMLILCVEKFLVKSTNKKQLNTWYRYLKTNNVCPKIGKYQHILS